MTNVWEERKTLNALLKMTASSEVPRPPSAVDEESSAVIQGVGGWSRLFGEKAPVSSSAVPPSTTRQIRLSLEEIEQRRTSKQKVKQEKREELAKLTEKERDALISLQRKAQRDAALGDAKKREQIREEKHDRSQQIWANHAGNKSDNHFKKTELVYLSDLLSRHPIPETSPGNKNAVSKKQVRPLTSVEGVGKTSPQSSRAVWGGNGDREKAYVDPGVVGACILKEQAEKFQLRTGTVTAGNQSSGKAATTTTRRQLGKKSQLTMVNSASDKTLAHGKRGKERRTKKNKKLSKVKILLYQERRSHFEELERQVEGALVVLRSQDSGDVETPDINNSSSSTADSSDTDTDTLQEVSVSSDIHVMATDTSSGVQEEWLLLERKLFTVRQYISDFEERVRCVTTGSASVSRPRYSHQKLTKRLEAQRAWFQHLKMESGVDEHHQATSHNSHVASATSSVKPLVSSEPMDLDEQEHQEGDAETAKVIESLHQRNYYPPLTVFGKGSHPQRLLIDTRPPLVVKGVAPKLSFDSAGVVASGGGKELSDVQVEERKNMTNTIFTERTRPVRNYVHNSLTQELDDACFQLLKKLNTAQVKVKKTMPAEKQKRHQRFMTGLRETLKGINSHRVRIVIIAPDFEPTSGPRGIDDHVEQILSRCQENKTPCLFALHRKGIGSALNLQRAAVTSVAVINADGAYEELRKVVSLGVACRAKYDLIMSECASQHENPDEEE